MPAAIVAIAVIGLLLSNFQKEAGIIRPSKGGIAAVAAAAAAVESAEGVGGAGHRDFSEALLVAAVAQRRAPLINPADARLANMLAKIIDCLYALRETWQTEMDQTWDPETHGTVAYWSVLHPALEISAEGPLTSDDVRGACLKRAGEILEEATDLAS